jgi:hypothetical protein
LSNEETTRIGSDQEQEKRLQRAGKHDNILWNWNANNNGKKASTEGNPPSFLSRHPPAPFSSDQYLNR